MLGGAAALTLILGDWGRCQKQHAGKWTAARLDWQRWERATKRIIIERSFNFYQGLQDL
jgi:hypothetical protein